MAASIKIDTIVDKDMLRGETRQKGIIISRSDGVTVTVSSASYRIFKTDGTAMTDSASATISNNGTAAVSVYAVIAAGTEPGGRYVEWTMAIGSWSPKAQTKYNVV